MPPKKGGRRTGASPSPFNRKAEAATGRPTETAKGKKMYYLMSQLWLFLLIAFVIGVATGWFTSPSGNRS